MGLNNSLTQVETQAHALGTTAQAGIQPMETLEEARLLLQGDANALVGHVNGYLVLIGVAP